MKNENRVLEFKPRNTTPRSIILPEDPISLSSYLLSFSPERIIGILEGDSSSHDKLRVGQFILSHMHLGKFNSDEKTKKLLRLLNFLKKLEEILTNHVTPTSDEFEQLGRMHSECGKDSLNLQNIRSLIDTFYQDRKESLNPEIILSILLRCGDNAEIRNKYLLGLWESTPKVFHPETSESSETRTIHLVEVCEA